MNPTLRDLTLPSLSLYTGPSPLLTLIPIVAIHWINRTRDSISVPTMDPPPGLSIPPFSPINYLYQAELFTTPVESAELAICRLMIYSTTSVAVHTTHCKLATFMVSPCLASAK